MYRREGNERGNKITILAKFYTEKNFTTERSIKFASPYFS